MARTVDELRARRAEIRRQLDQLREAGSKPEVRPNNGSLDAARLIVKSGLRFGQIKDAGKQKRALTQTKIASVKATKDLSGDLFGQVFLVCGPGSGRGIGDPEVICRLLRQVAIMPGHTWRELTIADGVST